MLPASLFDNEKYFLSERFILKLAFDPKGGLKGELFPFPQVPSISYNVDGLYQNVGHRIVFTVMGELSDPNLETTSYVYFLGEIFTYEDDKQFLTVRWLMDKKSFCHNLLDWDIEILIDCEQKDYSAELKKIRSHIQDTILK